MRTVWLEDCAQEEQRESEEEDAEAAIAEHEKDRSGLEGAVTVAIAAAQQPWAPQRGHLHLIGAGPGVDYGWG